MMRENKRNIRERSRKYNQHVLRIQERENRMDRREAIFKTITGEIAEFIELKVTRRS